MFLLLFWPSECGIQCGEFDGFDDFERRFGAEGGEGVGGRFGVDLEEHEGLVAFAADGHVGDVDVEFAEGIADETDDAGLVLVDDEDHVAGGDHVHPVALDAEDAGEVVGEDGADDGVGVGFAVHFFGDFEFDGVLNGALDGLAHGFGADVDAAGFGEAEGVDDVEVFAEEGLEEVHDGQALEGVGDALGEFAVGAEGDGVEAFFGDTGEDGAHALGEVGVGFFLWGEVDFDAAGVDGADEALAAEVGKDAGDDVGGGCRLGFGGAGAEVGGDDGFVAELEDFLVHGGGFGLVDVDGGAGDVSGVDGGGESDFIDEAAAGGVDEADAFFALGDLFGAEEGFAAGGVEGDVVAEGEKGVEVLDHFDLAVDGGFCEVELIEGDDLHFEAEGAFGDSAADAAEADDADGFSGELLAHEGFAVPLSGAEGGVGGGDFAGEGHHERDGMFCGGDGVGVGGVHDEDAGLGGGIDIDVVDADAGAGDGLEFAGPPPVAGEFGAADLNAGADDDAVVVAEDASEFAGLPLFLDGEFDVGLILEDGEAFGGERVSYKNVKHPSAPEMWVWLSRPCGAGEGSSIGESGGGIKGGGRRGKRGNWGGGKGGVER